MPAPAKYAYIDATRGLAILLVIATHHLQAVATTYPLTDLGRSLSDFCRLGVQLFFVASAYTLCLSMDRRSDELHPLLAFYIRRFFRIAPLYYLAVLLYALIGRGTYTPLSIGSNILFFHGFVKSAFNDVVPGGWSISAEMIFYLWFP